MPPGDVMEPQSEPTNTVWPFPFTPQDWEQTPPAVPAYLRTVCDELGQLHERIETLEARLQQNSMTSSRPPSSDSPYKKPHQRTTATTPRKAGGKPGPQGHRQGLLAPTRVVEVRPEPCVGGNTTFAGTRPYYTHQVIERKRSQEYQGGTNLATVGRKADHSAEHLVGQDEERRGERQAEHLPGFEIEDQLEPRGLLDGQIRRAGPAEELVDVRRRPAPQVGQTRAVGHQAPFLHILRAQ